jgi:hypothetical protein
VGKNFIFVSGCPRSGTTVLTHVLNWSDLAFIGQERYAALFNSMPEKFKPVLFSRERFFDFQQGDCAFNDFISNGEYSAWYANKKEEEDFGRAEICGDKITNLYSNFKVFDNPGWEQANIQIVHSIRNLFDVAASYQTRMLNPKDGWHHDYIKAISDWIESVEKIHDALQATDRKFNLHFVNYDSLFNGDLSVFLSAARKIYSMLSLDFSQQNEDGMKLLFDAGMKRVTMRKNYPGLAEDLKERVPESTLKKYQALIELSIC